MDVKMQEVQNLLSASSSMILKSSSFLVDFKNGKKDDIRESLEQLKDAMTLVGKTAQSLNQVRRDLIKPSLPKQYASLATDTTRL